MVAWWSNLMKFMDCDFESPYKCEMIHGAGFVVPPFALGTVFYSDGDVVE